MDSLKQNLQNEIDKLKYAITENEVLFKETSDPQFKLLIQEEITTLKAQISQLERSMSNLDGDYSNDGEHRNVSETETGASLDPNIAIIEIRAGTGGDEAGLFATDLYRMYSRYAELKSFHMSELFRSENSSGGIKTVTAEIKGNNIYETLKHETGVHRVQRVPTTEASGRIHTSTATVAILPIIKKINLEIKPEDLKWDFYRSGGKGGQNVNKVSTAVRLTHVPTSYVVECQQERTQGRNREKALEILESRLFTAMQENQVKSIDDLRASQVGTGERSEKIRTYNFPQDRITDHRLKKSWGNIQSILNGEADRLFKSLQAIPQVQP